MSKRIRYREDPIGIFKIWKLFSNVKKKKKKKNFFHSLFIDFYDEIELLDLTFIGIEVVNKFFN